MSLQSRTRVRPRGRWIAIGAAMATLSVLAPAAASAATPTAPASSGSPASCGKPGAPVQVTDATPDVRLTEAWRQFGNSGGGWANRGGWGASDGTYSAEMPGGDVLWMLNDTFMGPVNADESMPLDNAFVHNSAVLGGRDGLPDMTITAGTQDAPESLVGSTNTAPPWDPTGANEHWYWNGDGIVDGGKLRLFEYAQTPTDDEPPFNFAWTGTDIATFSTNGLELQGVTPTYADGGVSWGVELMRCGGWIYIYGVEGVPFNKHMHVARARVGHLVDMNWQFFDGTGWTSDPNGSARILENVGSSYSVTPVQGRYLLTTSDATLGDGIYVATADSPVGPFTGWTRVYTAPEAGNGIYAPYNIAAHPALSEPGELVISYNVNTWSIYDIYANANNNRPRFVSLQLG